MYADGYGQFPLGRESFQGCPRNIRRYVAPIALLCAIKCPYGVRVAEMAMRAQELFA